MRALLLTFSCQELRHHPWRKGAAVVAVMLGVALAFSVHLITASALDEFSSAVRSVNGQPDLELRAAQGSFDEALFAQVARHPQVALASPVVEIPANTLAADGARLPLRIVGVDALALPTLAPALMPVPAEGAARFALFAPDQVFLNAAARNALGPAATQLDAQVGTQRHPLQIAGTVAAGGSALAVMDIAAAQERFGRLGQLTRIDLRLQGGIDRAAFVRSLEGAPGWPSNVRIAAA